MKIKTIEGVQQDLILSYTLGLLSKCLMRLHCIPLIYSREADVLVNLLGQSLTVLILAF